MENIQGPLGFTDFDAEGMLIEGFDQLSTMATIYNHPYYPQHMEKLGFEKDADWVEYKIYIPDAIPEKHQRISDLIQRKYNLKIKKYTSSRKIAEKDRKGTNMEEKKIIQLKQGLTTAFINYSHASNLAYKPQFISNNYKEGRKVISSVEDELLNCEEFAISVAFITMGGITPLLQTLRELEYRGVRGKILTTDYLTFSEPEALRKLAQFENLELKMFVTENRKGQNILMM